MEAAASTSDLKGPEPGNRGGDQARAKSTEEAAFTVSAPSLELPKGGGAIRGIGEKFAANPVTGTGSVNVPIATSPGRAGFDPQLALSYDSGSGNGIFGFGWTLSLPQISRKTDKRLPKYEDASESDIFLISGAEDLVPLLNADTSRYEDRATAPGFVIHRYRPRIEGLFARIERWTQVDDGDVHWRSISRDNQLTVYGKDANSRIADPVDAGRVFSWLVCESRDDKGNAAVYEYKSEDGVGADLVHANERNRGLATDPRRTANRHLKRIRYGNRAPMLDAAGERPIFLDTAQLDTASWMFEVVLDYGEHDLDAPAPLEIAPWAHRADAFSNYRPGFEVRTARRCRRVLMFHHFPTEPEVGEDCLVRSTDFTYGDELNPPDPRSSIHSFLRSVSACGYRRLAQAYLKKSMPPVEFEYSVPAVQDAVQEVDATSLENLPVGLDGTTYLWTDLHGEGLPGVLTEQAGAWYYKRNLGPLSEAGVEFAALERVTTQPHFGLAGGQAQLLDLAGDGQPDLVLMEGPTPGFHEHDGAQGWGPFRPFTARLNRNTRDANLRFIDLDGDGHADVLITEDDAFVWHASLAEEGFGQARRVQQVLDEEKGPRLVFADPEQSIYLADMTGDGLTDLVRIRCSSICYWPNLGHGRFGAKVTMDGAPLLDRPDRFDQRRVRLADIDGDGGTDLVYLGGDAVVLYFNQSGNSWSEGQKLAAFPTNDNIASIQLADLMGNGTACLVWSSPLPGQARTPMRYVDLMGGQKPHLLIRSANNLGAETFVHYAPSTRFYLADKIAGKPWITKLPFPVQVVERVEIFDRISGNRFVTRYAYHHGCFDGTEREFRGFGMVEQWDTEEYAAQAESQTLPPGTNVDASSHVPPVLTRTWYHTGACLGGERISNYFAGLRDTQDTGEYYREPGLDDAAAQALLLPDTILPGGLTTEEEREACRALKGAMLRQEVYALDGSDKASHPYAVTEQNFTLRLLQPIAGNPHAVFFSHPREAISYHYERNPADPRIGHALSLEVDDFGNVLRSAAVGYGRRQADTTLTPTEQGEQSATHVTCTENDFTNAVDDEDRYRTPLPSESRSFEVTGLLLPTGTRFVFATLHTTIAEAEEVSYEASLDANREHKRLIEHVRTLYRPDDLGASHGDLLALLPLGQLESLALPGESYKLAFTPGLLAQVYGERVSDAMLADEGGYVHSEGDQNWWLHAGRIFLSPAPDDTATAELAFAKQHFFTPRRYRDPFHAPARRTESFVTLDAYDLVPVEMRDAIGNVVSTTNDYRTLQPSQVTDPNGNRAQVAFDALGLVVGTAVMGKPQPAPVEGDSLEGFEPDLDDATVAAHLDNPLADPHGILQRATTRLIYDLYAYQRTKAEPQPQASVVYALVRETHGADLATDVLTKVQHAFSYSDGFGREIQKKIQAEPGPVTDGGPAVSPRWAGSGWTVFNNKGKPVRQYEPFFTDAYRFEFDVRRGVSPILFYDPVQRVVATLNPNHTWQAVVFDSWRQETWDVNDTVLIDDPKEPNDDPDVDNSDVADFFGRLPDADYLPSWYAQRADGALGAQEQAAATKAAVHAFTPSVAHMDSLGRAFLTVAHNRFKRSDTPVDDPPEEAFHRTRVVRDIEGNQRDVIDALGRSVMRYDYDMLGNQVHSISMDAGERWLLNDVAGKPIRAWDSRGHAFRTEYDALRRPAAKFVIGSDASQSDPRVLGRELMFETVEYGEDPTIDPRSNLRTRPWRVHDTAGIVTTEAYDFKGNLLRGSRQLASDYKGVPDWSSEVTLEPEVFASSTAYDALNRPVTATSPDGSITRPAFNEANLLERIDVNLRGESSSGNPIWTPFVTDIDYDAKGQRESIAYGNGVRTEYTYDPLTFRLLRLVTRRYATVYLDDCPSNPPAGWPGCAVQNLHYTYDPTGNITHIQDDAQQTIHFRNTRVEPSNDYTYDATYQLIEATGREHLGQAGGVPDAPTAPDPFNSFHTGLLQPGDGNAMGLYRESYVYDVAGNFLAMQHRGTDPGNSGWTRNYGYQARSLIEPSKVSNRLSITQMGTGLLEQYTYDAHGSMTSMPHLPVMRRTFLDQLSASATQVFNGGKPETTYYVYDAAGQRVRKVTESQAAEGDTPRKMHERIYLGGYEIYREFGGDGREITLERETLHVTDDKQRIALVETRTLGNDGAPVPLVRYQISNHLGSASVELDETGRIISYEEYFPYGSTSYQAMDASISAAAKRYRYTGKGRDEETGLAHHEARYYAPWLGRWERVDPKGESAGINRYRYGSGNPVNRLDPSGLEDVAPQSWADWLVSSLPGSDIPLVEAFRTLGPTLDDPAHLDLDLVKEGQARTAQSVSSIGSSIMDIFLSTVGAGIEIPIARGWSLNKPGAQATRTSVVKGVTRTVVTSPAIHATESAALSRAEQALAKKTTERYYRNLEGTAARAAAGAGNEMIPTSTVRGIEGVPVIMSQGPGAEAAASLRHFADGQGFAFVMDPRNQEWVAIATAATREEGSMGSAYLRSGLVKPAAPRGGTHLDAAAEIMRRPTTLEEARSSGLFGGAVTMRADNTVELGVISGALNPSYLNSPGSMYSPVARALPEAEISMMTELFETMGFRVIMGR